MSEHGASEFGKELGMIHELIIAGRKTGADREFYTALLNNPYLFERTVCFVANKGNVTQYQEAIGYEEVEIVVDYTRPLDDLIDAAQYVDSKGYSAVDVRECCNGRCGLPGQGQKRVLLRPVCLGIPLQYSNAVATLNGMGFCRHATIHDLVEVDIQRPDFYKRRACVALGYLGEELPPGIPSRENGKSGKRLRSNWPREAFSFSELSHFLMVVKETDL